MKIDLGKKREVFWDDYLIDTEKTTAFHQVMEPVKKEQVFILDKGYENVGISYPLLVKAGDSYRMYYTVGNGREDHPISFYGVLESKDGINWERPSLGALDMEVEGMDNYMIEMEDNAFTFYDTNPDCPPDERFKTLVREVSHTESAGMLLRLRCYTSPDGYHLKKGHIITNEGRFDTLNTAFWDGEKYVAFIRDIHDMNEDWSVLKRDVRVIYSDDFKAWSAPKMIEFDDGLDYELYTNNIIAYERAPHIMIGFPTRYIEKKTWEGSTKQLASYKIKKESSEKLDIDRVGRVVTDAIFMCSRDGQMWHRYNEAFFRNGYEDPDNWVYGDGYPCYGFVDSGKESYYMYQIEKSRSIGEPKPIYRYEIRKDGFACIMAGGDEKVIVTKPLIFSGSELHLNFSGSAYGYMYVDVLDEDGTPISPESYEIYGDTIDRTVIFPDGSDFSAYAGQTVRLRFRLRDTKLFAMKFE